MTTTPGEKRQLAATAVRIKDHPSLSSFQAGRGSEPTPGSQPHRLDMRVLWLTKALIVWMRHKLSPSPSVDHIIVEYLELEGTHKDHPISWLYTGLLKKCLLGCITKTVCSRWGELILPPPPTLLWRGHIWSALSNSGLPVQEKQETVGESPVEAEKGREGFFYERRLRDLGQFSLEKTEEVSYQCLKIS